MKIFIILLSFLYSNLFYPQTNKTDLEVEYQLFVDAEIVSSMYCTLVANKNASIYHQKNGTAKIGLKESENNEATGVVKPSLIFEPYIRIDNQTKEILFFDVIGSNIFLVKDNYTELSWNISAETKMIGGYKCTKALTDFRGRQWIAWFTTEIPLSFGPWKLYGLPGLILEACDVSNRYNFKLIKITQNKSTLFSKAFSDLMTAKNNIPISFRQFLEDSKEYDDNVFSEIMGHTGGTTERVEMPRNGLELKYEWEK